MKTVNFKKLFSVILSLVIIMGAVPFTAIPASAATTHSHPLCGNSCRCETETHSNLTWTAWDGTTKLTGGNYYLTKNIELSSTMILDYGYTTRLCLNGYSITCEDRVFDIYSYRLLIITDCKGTGKIETTGYDCTIGNNKYLSIWGGTVLNSGGGLAIEAYGNTTTYVCGGRVESTEYDAIFAYPNSRIYVQGGTVKGSYCAISGNDVSGGSNSETVISGGTLTSVYSGDTVSVQSGSFTMTGGTVDGVVNVFPEYGKTTISGGTIGSLNTSSKEISITGGTILGETIDNWIDGESATISGGTFAGSCYFSSDNTEIGGGNFSACETVEISRNSGKTWIYGGNFDDITVYGSLYLSASPEINSLTVMKTGLVSAQNPDLSTSYGGEPIEVILSNELTSWKNGDTIVKNVNSDAVAQKFVYVGDDSRWVSLKRYNSNCVLSVTPHGSCGNDAYWAVEDNTLYIYGTGAVTYNDSGSKYPWWPYVDEIENIIVEEGITKIPAYTFEYCESAKTITLPETLTELHISAFNDCGSLNNLLLPSSLTKISYYNCYINRCESLTDLYYLGTAEELRTLLNGSTLSNWGGVPVLNVHCLELREGSSSCTEEGTSSYYQFDDTSVYGGMYDMDKNPITSLDRVPALGHDEIHHEAKAPTCTESGWNEYVTCSRCDYTSYAELAPLGHNYANGVCTGCGDVSVYIPEGLEYEIIDGEVTITGYTGSATELVIPETIEGYPVTAIGTFAFGNSSKKTVTKVQLPDSVVTIGDYAFWNNTKLVSINIPDKVNYIGEFSFAGCFELEKIYLPEGLKTIGACAFNSCYSLKNVTIPGSVETIFENVFLECRSLESVIVSEGVAVLECNSFTDCSALTSVTLPKSLTQLGTQGKYGNVFSSCESLSEVYYAGTKQEFYSIQILGENELLKKHLVCQGSKSTEDGIEYVIENDHAIVSGYRGDSSFITIPESIEGYPVTEIADYALAYCADVLNIVLPETLTTIGDGSFSNCTSITELVIPNSCVSIGTKAFENCENLSSIILSDNITEIRNNTFENCMNLESIITPRKLVSIGEGAFLYCSSLSRVTLYSNLSRIGLDAFGEGITVYYYGTEEQWNSIEIERYDDPMLDCEFSEIIFLGESEEPEVPAVPEGLEYEIIDGEVRITGYTGSATELVIPETIEGSPVTSIGAYAFSHCTSLTSIEIPEGVTSIGNCAFSHCTSITSIELPEGVTSIGDWAFSYCSSLTTVYYGGTEKMWNAISIASGNSYLTNAEIIFLGVEEPEVPEYIPGDIDMNGVVNGKDSFYLACALAGSYVIEEGTAEYLAADIDGDGLVNGKDAYALKCIISGSLII